MSKKPEVTKFDLLKQVAQEQELGLDLQTRRLLLLLIEQTSPDTFAAVTLLANLEVNETPALNTIVNAPETATDNDIVLAVEAILELAGDEGVRLSILTEFFRVVGVIKYGHRTTIDIGNLIFIQEHVMVDSQKICRLAPEDLRAY